MANEKHHLTCLFKFWDLLTSPEPSMVYWIMHSLVENPFQCLWFEQSREPLLAVLPEGAEEGLLLLSRRRGQVGTAAAACRHWCCCCGRQRRKSITRRWKVCRRGENDLSLVSQGKMSWRCFSRWISGSHLSLSLSLSPLASLLWWAFNHLAWESERPS